MKTEDTEILTIGAGPAGLIAAREAAQKGADVKVYEEHSEIGDPCHCAGLLSIEGLGKIGVPPDGPFVQNKVKGARFFSPSGRSFTVEKDKPVACVVDRGAFDRFLAAQASSAGAKIQLDSRIREIKRTAEGPIGLAESEQTEAKLIIDAEGISSRISKSFGLKPPDSSHILPGLQLDLTGVDTDPEHIEVHIGTKIAPGFFAWVIPLSKSSARIGLACKEENPKTLLDKFLKARFEDQKTPELVATRSGLVMTCGPIKRTFADNLLVVGDAAGQVKPTTGGGVIFGGICAQTAGKVAAEALAEHDFTEVFLRKYEILWKRKLDKEFRSTRLARRVLNKVSDETVDRLFEVVIKDNLQEEFSAEGDMDFQRGVIMKLMKKKKILGLLPSLWKALSPFER